MTISAEHLLIVASLIEVVALHLFTTRDVDALNIHVLYEGLGHITIVNLLSLVLVTSRRSTGLSFRVVFHHFCQAILVIESLMRDLIVLVNTLKSVAVPIF